MSLPAAYIGVIYLDDGQVTLIQGAQKLELLSVIINDVEGLSQVGGAPSTEVKPLSLTSWITFISNFIIRLYHNYN